MKHSKHKALESKIKSVNAGTGRRLTLAEQKLKTKDWPKSHGSSVAWPTTEAHKREHQNTFKRAWND